MQTKTITNSSKKQSDLRENHDNKQIKVNANTSKKENKTHGNASRPDWRINKGKKTREPCQ